MELQNNAATTATKQHIERMEFSTDTGVGSRARLGLLVLQTDQTVETDLQQLISLDGVATYHSRLANDPIVTPETLARMKNELPKAARLLPQDFGFSSIAYACTSGSSMIGENTVSEIINDAHPGVPCTNPLTAAKCALSALYVKRVALLTPYAPDVTSTLQANFTAAGFEVNVVGSFYEDDDSVVGRIDEESIVNAAVAIGKSSNCDGVFISCTSLRVANTVGKIEHELGKPVTASNHALAWHLLRLAGIDDQIENQGRLFTQGMLAS